ncbi:IS66 family insertion sequence element accessory protein TnpA [Amphibacillus marinus]|uniref:IS66 family insertion sequence element accessory protein TnpA n=1 Tax=Amphibacillus marinus TaxID=872970 RepID=UPI00115FD1DE|nr:hypothetical protein [Amphibacillus marinus]
MAAWSRQENVQIHQMYYWKRKLKQQVEADHEQPIDWLSYAQIAHPLSTDQAAIVMHVDQLSIHIYLHVDRELLANAIHLMKDSSY